VKDRRQHGKEGENRNKKTRRAPNKKGGKKIAAERTRTRKEQKKGPKKRR